ELRVPVPDEGLHRPTFLGQLADQVPGDLSDEGVVQVVSDAEEVRTPSRVLDREQHLEPLEEHRANRKEARRQGPFSLGPEELGPGRAPARRRTGPVAAKGSPGRRRTGPGAELAQLALGAGTAPAAALAAQAHDQLDQLRAHRWAPRASLSSPRSPLAPSGFPVPTEQRRRRD